MVFHNLISGNDITTLMISELLKETTEYFSNIVNQIEFIKELLSFQITKIQYCSNCKNRKTIFENSFILRLKVIDFEIMKL